VTVIAYEHVGMRVSDRDRAVALGFRVTAAMPEHEALERTDDAGIVLNLIANGVPREGARNALTDESIKMPGVTHAAFVVPDLDKTIDELRAAGISVSGGPIDLGRRRICLVRDPDGTVIEFDELNEGKRAT
jgi:lactoylglutathione lyase